MVQISNLYEATQEILYLAQTWRQWARVSNPRISEFKRFDNIENSVKGAQVTLSPFKKV